MGARYGYIFSLPFRDGCPLRVYILSPPPRLAPHLHDARERGDIQLEEGSRLGAARGAHQRADALHHAQARLDARRDPLRHERPLAHARLQALLQHRGERLRGVEVVLLAGGARADGEHAQVPQQPTAHPRAPGAGGDVLRQAGGDDA
eukprot:9472765-Pyramimonas_sp.AAC.1